MSAQEEPVLVGRKEAARLLNISIDTLVKKLLAEGELHSVRIGKKVLIPRREIDDLIQRRLDGRP